MQSKFKELSQNKFVDFYDTHYIIVFRCFSDAKAEEAKDNMLSKTVVEMQLILRDSH